MEEKIKEQIKTGIGLWIISWLGTIAIAIVTYNREMDNNQFPAVLILCDIIFPFIVIMLIKRLKEIRSENE